MLMTTQHIYLIVLYYCYGTRQVAQIGAALVQTTFLLCLVRMWPLANQSFRGRRRSLLVLSTYVVSVGGRVTRTHMLSMSPLQHAL